MNFSNTNIDKKFLINLVIVFLFTFIVSINIFNLSYNFGILSEVHGPLYLDIAKGLYENKFFSNYYNLIPESNIYTFQVGISLIHYFGILTFGLKYWYFFPIFLLGILWSFAYIYFSELLIELKLDNNFFKDICFLSFFLQPYNLNQIASYSNEMIYFPLSIIIFIFLYNYIFNIQKVNSISKICLFPLIIVGIFFRFHHTILIISIFISYFYIDKKEFSKISFFIIFILSNLIILTLFLFYISGISNTFYIFVNYISDFFLNKNIFDTLSLAGINTSVDNTNYFSLAKINDGLNVFSGHLILNKFISNEIVIFIINIVLIWVFYRGLKIIDSKFLKLIIYYFIILSVIFLYILPPNELNYYLPTSFIIIFLQILFTKYYSGIYFKKLIISFCIFFLLSISYLLGGGYFLSDKLEIIKKRENSKMFENFLINDFIKEESLVFKTDELTFSSNLSKDLDSKFCNSSLNKCLKLMNNVNYIYLFGRIHKDGNIEFQKIKEKLLFDLNKKEFKYKFDIITVSRYIVLKIKIL